MSSGLRKLAVAAASLACMAGLFLLAEVGLRLFGVQPRDWPAAGFQTGLPLIEVDPLLGPLPRPGWSGRWFRKFDAAFDARGLRTTGLPPPAAPRARVAFVGDSCTFGWGLDTPDTFVARLDARQRAEAEPSVAWLNAAYLGQSAVVGEHMVVDRVLPLRPDVVVIGYGANNAFRFSLVADAERFRAHALRRWIFRSRLLHVLAAELIAWRGAAPDPRRRAAVDARPLADLRRLAPPDEFARSMRQMVHDVRAAGAEPLLLIFPRASAVSTQFSREDPARTRAARWPGGAVPAVLADTSRTRTLLEASCLNHRDFDDPLRELAARAPAWQAVYPDAPATRALLQAGAARYAAGDAAAAVRHFEQALAADPERPLALYDLGVAQIAAGAPQAGLAALARADALACNIFLHYQVLIWQLAVAEQVPVVDLTLWFQTRDGESLFLDPAHPNALGQQLIADALAPALAALTS